MHQMKQGNLFRLSCEESNATELPILRMGQGGTAASEAAAAANTRPLAIRPTDSVGDIRWISMRALRGSECILEKWSLQGSAASPRNHKPSVAFLTFVPFLIRWDPSSSQSLPLLLKDITLAVLRCFNATPPPRHAPSTQVLHWRCLNRFPPPQASPLPGTESATYAILDSHVGG